MEAVMIPQDISNKESLFSDGALAAIAIIPSGRLT
jgi:hypothetical protein